MAIPASNWVENMYDLTPEQLVVYGKLYDLVEFALIQFDAGLAVNVEPQMAAMAKDLVP